MKIIVKINQDLCIGSGSCVIIAAKHFILNSKGKAQLKQLGNKKVLGNEITLTLSAKEKEQLIEAAGACPMQAITIIDENGNKVYG